MSPARESHRFEWIKSSRTVFASMAVGIAIGILWPKTGRALSVLGDFYLALLKMCVLPIVITALVTSFARILKSGNASKYLKRMLLVFWLGLLTASISGVMLSSVFSPKILSNPEVRVVLGEIIAQPSGPPAPAPAQQFSVVRSFVPENIFYALAHSQMLPILLFFVLLGVALSQDKKGQATHFLLTAEGLRDAFLTMIGWFIYLLPLGILGLFAGTFGSAGPQLFTVLLSLISVLLFGIVLLLAVHVTAVSWMMRQSPGEVIRSLKEPLMIALGTSSSFAALPSMIRTLRSKYGVEEWFSGFVAPMAVTFNGWAGTFFNSFIVIFIARVYEIPLGPGHYAIAALGAILQSWSSSGLPATASVVSMVILFRPMGIPIESMVGLLLALLPLLDPLFTVLNVSANLCANLVIRFRESR
ncbi:MAG: cation:dicarboxylase symporter family transporter [Bdellovibrionales bacterium]|nr:cation:dicarboxylase symporter family transporter [Bdellovibrionales bacterium]